PELHGLLAAPARSAGVRLHQDSPRRNAVRLRGLGRRASDFRRKLGRLLKVGYSRVIRAARARDFSQLTGGPRPEVRVPRPLNRTALGLIPVLAQDLFGLFLVGRERERVVEGEGVLGI